MNTKFDNYFDTLRIQMVSQLASLLESQTRNQIYVSNIVEMIRNLHNEISAHLIVGQSAEHFRSRDPAMDTIATDYARMKECLDLLFSERAKQWLIDRKYLQTLMHGFNIAIDQLSETLSEKRLLERQNKVLERIILSHERITHWKEFVREILTDFHQPFPFDYFFIAFPEERATAIFIYYPGACSESFRSQVRAALARNISGEFQLESSPVTFEEFILDGISPSFPDSNTQVPLITADIPQHAPGMSGRLGIALASEKKISAHEESVIQSILAVLVMVVGSSKALSHTLSELEHRALHDSLTGLPNRRYFNSVLEYEVKQAERNSTPFSLLLLDIDNLTDINDTYGYVIGDEALRLVGGILLSYIRKEDLTARIGGGEFAVILSDADRSDALRIANTIASELSEKVFTSGCGKQFHITVSIGIVSYPQDGSSSHDLRAGADLALYNAKKIGKNAICCGNQPENKDLLKQPNPDHAESLRVAMRENRFLVYFQPIINCRTGAIFGYEAVARLKEPNGKIILADNFIDTIERYGLAREFDRVVIDKAIDCRNACKIANCQLQKPKIFINLSAQEIESPGILGYAEELCERLSLSPRSIVFEITERETVNNMKKMGTFITRLRDKGFGFALDGFGSGHNSFRYLRELRFDYAKIDGAYVRNMLNSKIDYAFVDNLFNLCRDLDIGIIAEHVENKEIFDKLCEMGVDYAQGLYIGLPHPKMDCWMYHPPSWDPDSLIYHKCLIEYGNA
jgi:diguanylate cyclase (GGDEF)-like protein